MPSPRSAQFCLITALAVTAALLPGPAMAANAAPVKTRTRVALTPTTVAYGQVAEAAVRVRTKKRRPSGTIAVHAGRQHVSAEITNFRPANPDRFTSSASEATELVVVKDATAPRVRVRHRKAKKRVVVRSRIVSAHGRVPKGAVRVELRRGGVQVRSKRIRLDARGVARAKFAKR